MVSQPSNPIMQSGVFPPPQLLSFMIVNNNTTPLVNGFYNVTPVIVQTVNDLGYGNAIYPNPKEGIKFNGFSKVIYLTADGVPNGDLAIRLEGTDIQGNVLVLEKTFTVDQGAYVPIILNLDDQEDFNSINKILISETNFPVDGLNLFVYLGSDGKIFYFDQDTFMLTQPYITWGLVEENVEGSESDMGDKEVLALRTFMARPYGKEKLDLTWYVPYTNFLTANKTTTYTTNGWSPTNWINEIRYPNFNVGEFLNPNDIGNKEIYWNIFQRGIR